MVKKRQREEKQRRARNRETARLLGLHVPGLRPCKYDRNHHPRDIIKYFRDALDKVEEVERVTNRIGDVKHVQAPVSPPTLAGYAAKIDVSTECIWAWAVKYQEFQEAKERAQAIQLDVFIRMSVLGAWDRSVTIFALKNLHGWTDRAELSHKGTVSLSFDAQDENA